MLVLGGCADRDVDAGARNPEDSGAGGVALPGADSGDGGVAGGDSGVVEPWDWWSEMDLTDPVGVDVVAIPGGEGDASLGMDTEVVADVTGDGLPDVLDHAVSDGSNYLLAWSGVDPATGDSPLPDVELGVLTPKGGILTMTLFHGPGDLDGDGYPDVLIGSWYGRNEYAEWSPDSGFISLVPGPIRSGAPSTDATSAWLYSEVQGRSFIGTSAASLGDQNADGLADFVVGSGIYPARVYIEESPAQSTAWLLHGPVGGTRVLEDIAYAQIDLAVNGKETCGAKVQQAGDLNGDGLIDVVVGSPNAPIVSSTSGGVFVFHAPLEGLVSWSDYDALLGDMEGQGTTGVGSSVAADLDVDGDGLVDLWIGAWGYRDTGSCASTYEGCGAASLVLGPVSGDLRLWEWQEALVISSHSWSSLGYTADALGDIDGDGLEDVAIGAYDDGAAPGTGSVTLAFGGISGTHLTPGDKDDPDLAYLHGDEESRHLGLALGGGHDLDQDGWPDLVIGDPWYDPENTAPNPGRLFVLFGGTP